MSRYEATIQERNFLRHRDRRRDRQFRTTTSSRSTSRSRSSIENIALQKNALEVVKLKKAGRA